MNDIEHTPIVETETVVVTRSAFSRIGAIAQARIDEMDDMDRDNFLSEFQRFNRMVAERMVREVSRLQDEMLLSATDAPQRVSEPLAMLGQPEST